MIVRVASTTPSKPLAHSLMALIKQVLEDGEFEDGDDTIVVQTIGASALNQAVKGIAIAHLLLARDGIQLFVTPQWTNVQVGEEQQQQSAIQLYLHVKQDEEESPESLID